MILVSHFQLRIFCDSVTGWKVQSQAPTGTKQEKLQQTTLQEENPANARADLIEKLREMRATANCSQLSSNLPEIHTKLTFPGDLLSLPPSCVPRVIRPEVE